MDTLICRIFLCKKAKQASSNFDDTIAQSPKFVCFSKHPHHPLDPWDERYIYWHMKTIKINHSWIGKYQSPMDPMHAWNLFVLYFGVWILQKKAKLQSNQRSSKGSRWVMNPPKMVTNTFFHPGLQLLGPPRCRKLQRDGSMWIALWRMKNLWIQRPRQMVLA